jgi:hypothetical protein
MNPRIAGEPGRAMANAAEQMGSVAEMGFHVAEKLQEAQETVDVKMGEVGIDKLEADAHAAIGKATTPEQMQDIQRGFEEQAQEAVNSQKNPKVSRALQFYGAHKSIGIQDLATVRQAKVTTENDLAANDMLGTKYSGDYVLAAAAGGDTTMAENDERILLASSVNHGTMTQEQADDHFDKWLKASKMDTIGALANSPKPEDRQRVIKMLRESGAESKQFTDGGQAATSHPEDAGYQEWLRKTGEREDPGYDTYGAYKAGLNPTANGHMSDEYKLPTHPTYSTEALSSQKPGAPPAGEWIETSKDKWTFKATQTNVDNAGGVDGLKQYFDQVEPGNKLVLPNGESYTGNAANAKHSEEARPSVSVKPTNHPLVDGMNLAERNTTLTAAERKDHELTEMAGAQNLNGVLNNMHDAFGKFPYTNNGKGDYEARENAVDDGDFLKSIGAVTPDGKPDRVMGEKLQQEVTRQRAEWEKEAADKDVKAIDKYEPNIAKMTRPQIFQIPYSELSAHGRSYLLSKWDENYRVNRSISLAERQEARQEQEQKSSDTALNVLADIRSGKIYTPIELRTMPGLVSRDRTQLIDAATESQKDPTYRAAIGLLSDTFTPPPLPKNASEMQATLHTQQSGRQNEMAVETWAAFQQMVNAHPERNKMEVMQEALKPAVQKQIADRVSQMFPVQSNQSWVAQNFNRLMGARPSSGLPSMPKLTGTPTRPSGVPANAVWNEGAKQWQLPR